MGSYRSLDTVEIQKKKRKRKAPKLTLSKLKKNTLCLPDVVEDDRVWISKARDRVVK